MRELTPSIIMIDLTRDSHKASKVQSLNKVKSAWKEASIVSVNILPGTSKLTVSSTSKVKKVPINMYTKFGADAPTKSPAEFLEV